MKHQGFSLIELVVFIVVMGLSVSLLFPLIYGLKNAGTLSNQTKAQQIAQSRMELILDQRGIVGFSTFADPCVGGSPPAVCTPPTGFSVSAPITNNWSGNTNYKIITVNVTGSAEAHLTSLVAYYD